MPLAGTLWTALGGNDALLEALHFSEPAGGLPSRFHVSDLATATIGGATLAAAELWAARREEALRPVTVDRRLAAAAFRCERLLQPVEWKLPAIWDPIAGDYQTADGWIRLHTNYSYHRDAVTRVLDVPADRQRVAAAVKSRNATELESAVVAAGGCAAALRTMGAWRVHPQGAALASEALCDWDAGCAPHPLSADASAPLCAQVWKDGERANGAVMREAGALRTVLLLATIFPDPMEARIRGLVRRHIQDAVDNEWPAMAQHQTSLPAITAVDIAALEVILSVASQGEAQATAQREMISAFRSALNARERLVVSRAKINWVKWTVVLLLGGLILVTVAIVHSDNRRTAAIAMALFAVGMAACVVLIASHNEPFTGEISVSPSLLLQVMPRSRRVVHRVGVPFHEISQ